MPPWTLHPGHPQHNSSQLCSPCGGNDHSSFYHSKYILWRPSTIWTPTSEENILRSKRSTPSPSRSTHTMENAWNFGSMRSTTTDSAASEDLSISFSGLLKTGDHAMSLSLSDCWRAFFDLPRRISLCWLHGQPTSCDDRFPGIDGSWTGFSIASIALWPIKSQVLLPPLLLGDHAWHLYGPAAGSCSGTWKFGILEPFWFGCVWDNVIGSSDTLMRSSGTRKNPASAGCVCVCGEHLHRCKTSFGMFFNHAGGRSVMVSLPPTKTPTIDGDTRLG